MENVSSTDIINKLIRELGFSETEELTSLREEVISNLSNLRESYPLPSQLIYLRTQYQIKAGEVINLKGNPMDFAKAQIGLIITQAQMFKSAGWENRYREEIQDAITYTENMGFNDIAQTLRSIQTNPPQN